MFSKKALVGLDESFLVKDTFSEMIIHQEMQQDLNALRKKAEESGFELTICSSYRGFFQQLNIWNNKALGKRVLLDDFGNPLDYNSLSPKEILYAILRWSALPGASRHHWGCEIDVFDKRAVSEDYKLKLTPDETVGDGPFAPMHDWLDIHLEEFHFFRPYAFDIGGIAPERWHLSYRPVSEIYFKHLTYDLLFQTIQEADIELREEILSELPHIYEKYVLLK